MNPNKNQSEAQGHFLIQAGVVLFLLGLLTGFVVPLLANPRMGLSSHLEGVMNGMLLVLLGLVWPRLVLSAGALKTAFGLVLYGTFSNWGIVLMSAIWNAGSAMSLAAGAHQGTPFQEGVINFFLYSLSLAMVAVCLFVLTGLRKRKE